MDPFVAELIRLFFWALKWPVKRHLFVFAVLIYFFSFFGWFGRPTKKQETQKKGAFLE